MSKDEEVWVEVDYDEVTARTLMAVKLKIDRRELWIPLSQISPEDQPNLLVLSGVGMCRMREWMAVEKELV